MYSDFNVLVTFADENNQEFPRHHRKYHKKNFQDINCKVVNFLFQRARQFKEKNPIKIIEMSRSVFTQHNVISVTYKNRTYNIMSHKRCSIVNNDKIR